LVAILTCLTTLTAGVPAEFGAEREDA
jgi:hypothetical protein